MNPTDWTAKTEGTSMTKIQTLIEGSLAGMRWAKCLKNVGIFLLGAAGASFGIYLIFEKATDQKLLPAVVKSATLPFIVIVAFLGIAASVAGVALLFFNKRKLSKHEGASRGFELIREAPDQLIKRVRALGARGETTDTFVQVPTLEFLIASNRDYVQAWGRPARGKGSSKTYTDVCFFVVAPLNSIGLRDMTTHAIKNNKYLRKEHVAKDPRRCVALYVIEVFGQGPTGSKSRGAVLRILFDYLERTLGERLAGASFRIFARPATADGMRETERYSFMNLGEGDKDMHAWQPPETRSDLCSTVLSVFRPQS